MKRTVIYSSKVLLALIVALYVAYFIKTVLGINVSNNYSAARILKAPIQPIWNHKTEICAEFQTLCSLRKQVKDQIQERIDHVKREV